MVRIIFLHPYIYKINVHNIYLSNANITRANIITSNSLDIRVYQVLMRHIMGRHIRTPPFGIKAWLCGSLTRCRKTRPCFSGLLWAAIPVQLMYSPPTHQQTWLNPTTPYPSSPLHHNKYASENSQRNLAQRSDHQRAVEHWSSLTNTAACKPPALWGPAERSEPKHSGRLNLRHHRWCRRGALKHIGQQEQ